MSDVFIDSRDGNIYKTVEINGKIWLAENLRYKGVDFHYPNNDERKTKFYGLLYEWKDAIQACPDGWHLPTKYEFDVLLKIAGSSYKERCKNLSSKSWRGTDSLGFSALPSGYYFHDDYYLAPDYYGACDEFGTGAYFWLASEKNIYVAYGLYLGKRFRIKDISIWFKNRAHSVRCIKD